MKKYTFKKLFENESRGVLIPKIQRDYAQGRKGESRVRDNFLSAIYSALSDGRGLNLDFIYGADDSGNLLIPLDGQQRLTTLYLLYWLTAKYEGKDCFFLSKFSYETRYSSRRFCEFLTTRFSDPVGGRPISELLRNHPEYAMDWDNDPTVDAMLRMLDAIEVKFFADGSRIPGLWERLELVSFYKESIKNLALPTISILR